MKIELNKVVAIDYVLTDDDGKELDSSKMTGPLEYLHGRNNLIPGLESQLEGKNPGDKFTAVVAAKDAYGEYDPRLAVEVPKSQFDTSLPLEVGMKFQAETNGGFTIVTITKISDETVTVDANHELAGKTLHFEVEVKDVREATPEQIERGSLATGCGCGGGCGGNCGEGGCGGEGCGEGGCGGEGECSCGGGCGGCGN